MEPGKGHSFVILNNERQKNAVYQMMILELENSFQLATELEEIRCPDFADLYSFFLYIPL